MAIKTVTISGFELHTSFDRDRTVHAHTEDKKVADAWREHSAFNGYRVVNKTFFFIESMDDLKELERQRKIQAALDKLTSEEQHLLGLV